jgi:transcriptional regulator with XRE-family HTH domain
MNFGAFVREQRETRDIGLRQMAKMIGVSPTYLSKVERDEFPPPAEDKVKAIAKIISCDADELLALANRVSSDVIDIIMSRPVELAELVRSTTGLPPEMISSMIGWAQQRGLAGGHPQQQNLPGPYPRQRRLPGAQPLQQRLPSQSKKPTQKRED